MVSTALRVTGTAVGASIIRCDEYDVIQEDVDVFDGSEDGGKYRSKNGATSKMLTRKMSMRKMSTNKISLI